MINGNPATNLIIFILIFFDVMVILLFLRWLHGKGRGVRMRRQFVKEVIQSGNFILAAVFENHWVIARTLTMKPSAGFAVEDGPGCYVIKTFSHPVDDIESSEEYEDLFVGHSTNVCQFVHDSFNGKGDNDIMKAVRADKVAFMKIELCEEAKMEELEKELRSTCGRAE